MSFEVFATDPFERKLKKLSKKQKSLKQDLSILIDKLIEHPDIGEPLGKDCFKIRLAISSKGKGKSGGARIITYVRVVKSRVYLMNIYDKSEQSTISDKDLVFLLDLLSKD